ncbi:MAG: hypothetical protein NZ534_04695, partial [Bacteroidia bacterium]|nr:hypothetical protein [Bacteroidia bacterium]
MRTAFWAICLALATACDRAARMPTYIAIPQTLLIVGADTFADTGVEDVWVYHDRDIQGVYPVGAIFPVVPGERDFFTFMGGVRDGGDVEIRKQFPFWTLDTAMLKLEPRETLYYIPKFKYVSSELLTLPVNEDFEGVGVSFEPLSNRADTTLPYRTTQTSFTGATCLRANFDSTRRHFFLRTNQTFKLPADDRQVWAEVAYKGNIKFGLGLLGEVGGADLIVNAPFIPALPPDPERWQIVHFDLSNIARNL